MVPFNFRTKAAQHTATAQWRNGSASDSRSEGWEFESLLGHACASRLRKVMRDGQETFALQAAMSPR